MAKELGATNFATYVFWLLLIEVLGYANLGLPTVLFRNLSMDNKDGLKKNQQKTINLVISNSILLNLFCFTIIFLVYRFDLLPINLSLTEFGLLLIARSMSVYLAINKNIAKGKGLVVSSAWLEAVNAIIMPIINMVLVIYFNLVGVMVAHIISSLISLKTLKLNNLNYIWNFELHYAKIIVLLKISIPLYLAVTFEGLIITLPIFLAGYSAEALLLGAFLYVFQYTRPERIPLFSYLTVAIYRELLLVAAEDPLYQIKHQWRRVSILLRQYFLITLTFTMVFFILMNITVRIFLQEYIEQLWLLKFTIPALSFFALRRIFNAHFTATGNLWKRINIYLLSVSVTGLMYFIFKDGNFISTTVLAIWLSLSTFVSGMVGYISFLRDARCSTKSALQEILFVIFVLLGSTIHIDFVLKISTNTLYLFNNNVLWLLLFSCISFLLYLAFVIMLFLLTFGKSEFKSFIKFKILDQR